MSLGDFILHRVLSIPNFDKMSSAFREAFLPEDEDSSITTTLKVDGVVKHRLPEKQKLFEILFIPPMARIEVLQDIARQCGGALMSYDEIKKVIADIIGKHVSREVDCPQLATRISQVVAASATEKYVNVIRSKL